MSILFITDIHADIKALNAILRVAYSTEFEERYGKISLVYNTGDVLERGYHPREVIERLDSIPNLKQLIGNHEEALIRKEWLGAGDIQSCDIHRKFMDEGGLSYFDKFPKTILDKDNGLYLGHGGIIDPWDIIPFGTPIEATWLYTETWQRPTDQHKAYYDPWTGYYYRPEMGFEAAKKKFHKDGFIIVNGHQHNEHGYSMRDGVVSNILEKVQGGSVQAEGINLKSKAFLLDSKASYHFVVGAATMDDQRSGWGRCHFGLLHNHAGQRTFNLFNFRPGDLKKKCGVT